MGRNDYRSFGFNALWTPNDDFELEYTGQIEETDQDTPPLLNTGQDRHLFCSAYGYCSPALNSTITGDRRETDVDGRLQERLIPVLGKLPDVEKILLVQPRGALSSDPRLIDFSDALAGQPDTYTWPEHDERSAAGICYTSGTTGNPKGVVYSHKTTYLHALASRAVDSFGVCERDTILMLPSMFHANAWGLPYSGWLSGADMLMPGPHTQIAHLRRMIETARPTLTAMVPTILGDLLGADREAPLDLGCFRSIISGGSAVPSSMIEAARQRWGVPVVQGWGMTETSPMCVLSHPPKDRGDLSDTQWRMKSGRPVPGIEVRVVDEHGVALAEDGRSVGELQLRRFLVGRVARFWIPEYWCITDEIAKTSVGKMDKRLLREKNRCGALSVERSASYGDESGGI